MSNEKTYAVNRRLDHDGEEYFAGGEVSMSVEQAENLIAIGVLSEASDASDDDKLQGGSGDDTLKGGSDGPTKPEGDDLTQAIMCVIEELDHAKDFTKGGNPKVASVEAVLGYDVTAAEVANAWDVYPEGNE